MRKFVIESAVRPDRRPSGFYAFLADEDGATAIEYALIVGLIFLAIVASVTAYTQSASEMYSAIDENLQ